MKRFSGVLLLGVLLTTGCATQTAEPENEVEPVDQSSMTEPMPADDGNATPIAGSEAASSALQEEILTAQQLLEQVDSPLASKVIYFEYDSASVNDESLALLEAHGNFIASNGNVFVRLEGHADERGSREYNIGLGDRRAQSVRRILLFQGASTDQLDTISYGEEQPAELGHNEAVWSKNRRVELVYEVR